MDELSQALLNYKKLLDNTQYHFIIGKNKKSIDLKLNFTKQECFHLLGLQYISELRELKNSRADIFDELSSNPQLIEKIINSKDYEPIKNRVVAMTQLESIIDDAIAIYKFNPLAQINSKIEADYILKLSRNEKNTYLFISESNNGSTYFCRSIFTRDNSETDFSTGHIPYTLLLKEKTNLKTNQTQELYRNKSYRPEGITASPNIQKITFNSPKVIGDVAVISNPTIITSGEKKGFFSRVFDKIDNKIDKALDTINNRIAERNRQKEEIINALTEKLARKSEENGMLKIQIKNERKEYSEKITALNQEINRLKEKCNNLIRNNVSKTREIESLKNQSKSVSSEQQEIKPKPKHPRH